MTLTEREKELILKSREADKIWNLAISAAIGSLTLPSTGDDFISYSEAVKTLTGLRK